MHNFHTLIKNRIRITSVCAFLFALLLIPIGVQGEKSDRYAGESWALLKPETVLVEAAKITTNAYPDCDYAIVEQKSVRLYRPDGTGEAQDETFLKVLTEKGKRANRTVRLQFMLPYTTVEVVKLEVIGTDGNTTPVDVAANSKETIDSGQMAMNIYDPNMKLLEVNIPKIEPGEILHSVTRTTTERPIMPGEFSEYNVMEGRGYI